MAALNLRGKAVPGEIVIATRNPGKLREMQALLDPLGFTIFSLKDFPEIPPVAEDGATFAENAGKKAKTVADRTGRLAIADDSGLVVKALGGRPGVLSSRFAGEKATDGTRCQRVLQEMAGIPEEQRDAAFVCAIAIALPRGKMKIVEVECQGRISFAPRGENGFGFDPIFFVPEFGKTMAELEPEVKNQISHRARALNRLKLLLPQFLAQSTLAISLFFMI
jgi:XTP/dITP diphosphohydrolase